MQTLRLNSYLTLFVGVVLACVINYFPIPFFTGAEFIFGNAIAVALTILLGLRYGLICSLLASSVCLYTWGHPLAYLPFLLEVLIVYVAQRKKGHFMAYGLLYWFTLGWLIVAIEYYFFSDYLLITKMAIVIKYVVNGGLNIIAGYILVRALRNVVDTDWSEVHRLQRYISSTFFIIVTLGVLSNTLFWLRNAQQDKLTQFQTELLSKAGLIGQSLEDYINNHLKGLSLSSRLLSESPKREELSKSLVAMAQQYPNILTLLSTDRDGKILATYPQDLLDKVNAEGQFFSVEDRPYFYEVKSHPQPYVSDVFQGRGFGHDPIVALSVPYFITDVFAGVLEASLDLKKFQELDEKHVVESEKVLIFDQNSRVIYASKDLGYNFLQSLEGQPVLEYLEKKRNYYFINFDRQYLMAESATISPLGWQVAVLVPRVVYEQQIAEYVIYSLSLLLLLLIVSGFITVQIARKLSSPFVSLTEQLSTNMAKKELEQLQVELSTSNIEEVNQLTDIVVAFSKKLNETLKSLKEANRDANSANKQLEELNNNLESIVAEQTSQIRSALDEANEASRAKSEFLATMSHEIRTPMNGVLGMIELLMLSPLNLEQKNKLKVAESSARSLLGLINDILDFSKIEAEKIEIESIEFSLIELLSDVVQSFAVKVQETQVKIVLDTQGIEVDRLESDPTRIRQVLTNLIGNALKFTKSGCVSIGCSSVWSGEDIAISIAVKDTGIGIAKDKLSALFDPFTQADSSTTREFGGTGLGLAISKRLCQFMSGDLSVNSELGVGSEFTASFTAAGSHSVFDWPDLNDSFYAVLCVQHEYEHHLHNLIKSSHSKPLFVPDIDILEKAYSQAANNANAQPFLIVLNQKEVASLSHDLVVKINDRKDVVAIITPITIENNKTEFANTVYIYEPITPHQFYTAILERNDETLAPRSVISSRDVSAPIRVLLVEDNPINQEIAKNMLETFHCHVHVVENGLLAITTLASEGTSFDIVLMDCQMPEMDGFEATKRIRAGKAGEDARTIPIIALTANAMKGDKEKCIQAGMTDYLSKPISLDALRAQVEKYALQGKDIAPI